MVPSSSSSGSPSTVFKNANGSISKPVQNEDRVSPLVVRQSSLSVGGSSGSSAGGSSSASSAGSGVKMSVITSGIRESRESNNNNNNNSNNNNGNGYYQQNYPYFS